MSYSTNVRTVLKNINKEDIGTISLEIVFIDDDSKKKVRRYVNTKQRIQKDDVIRSKIKQVDRTKLIREIVEKKTVELKDKLRSLELAYGTMSPEIYDMSITTNQYARKTVSELFDEFIADQEDNNEPLTVKKHNTTKTLLTEYCTKKGISKLYLPDLNQRFYKDFSNFLKKTKKHAPATINKYQESLKTFMQFLNEELGLNKEMVHKFFKKVSKKTEGGSKVVLLKEHVQKLIDWKPTNERYELVRDLFLFQILTGIRHSDLKNVNKSYVINNSLSFDMWKVQKHVAIPLHPLAKGILKKYNFKLGDKCKTQQNYNLDIKTVCKEAGLTDEIKSLKIKLSRKISEDTPLYKLVSTHVGRTTFITNCLIAGISPFIVMEYTGHEKIETLSIYMRIAGTMAKDAFTKFEDYFTF